MISLTKNNELKGYKSLDVYPEVAHFVTTRHEGISRSLRLFQLFALYQRLMHERQSQSELVVSVHESSDKGVVYS